MNLNWANGFSQAGDALGKIGLEGFKATLEEDKIKLADSLTGAREVAADTRREGAAIRAEERGLINRGKERKEVFKETVENAPALRDIAVADWEAKKKAELDFETNPDNVEARATAKAAGDKIIATAAAATSAELLKDPAYLKNVRAIALAEHPERAAQAASAMSAAAVNQYELGQKKLLSTARDELSRATTPETKAAAKSKIEALSWTLEGQRAQDAGDAAVLRSLEANIKDNRTQAGVLGIDPAVAANFNKAADNSQRAYDAMVARIVERKGVATPGGKPAPYPDGTVLKRAGQEYVVQNGVPVPRPAGGAAPALAAGPSPVENPVTPTSRNPGAQDFDATSPFLQQWRNR